MRGRLPRVFDASALIGWHQGHPFLAEIADQAEAGWFQLVIPATAVVDAESELRYGWSVWAVVFDAPGIQTMPLGEHTAVEIGMWPGPLSARHAAYAAADGRGVVVTRQPGLYQGLTVQLLAV